MINKVMLEIDEPECCDECPLWETSYFHGCRIIGEIWLSTSIKRPVDCPLKQIPEKEKRLE